jgi:glutamyl-tRNA synthetase
LVRTRFAPSPTGYLHIGGVRTALFCWLYAKNKKGQFLLRIEDTDLERSTQESINAIHEGMQWLKLNHDEEPVYQSQRMDLYQQKIEELLESGCAYRCYCTQEELDAMRKEQSEKGETPGYDGRCREIKEPKNGEFVIRFKSPEEGEIIINDHVFGNILVNNQELDDFILVRSNGVPTYHFSVVVDDHDTNISHVIRGDDHLKNTAKQIHLFNAFGYKLPQFVHLPMILGPDGGRLSKRHGAMNILEYKQQGFLPEAILNYLVRLGWSSGDQEIFSIKELVEKFDLTNINKSSARFDAEKLQWVNQQHLSSLDNQKLSDLLTEQATKEDIELPSLEKMLLFSEAYKNRVNNLNDLLDNAHSLFSEKIEIEEKAAKKHLRSVILEPLKDLVNEFEEITWAKENIHGAIENICKKHEIGFGKIGQPLRVAVTGNTISPPIDVTLALIEKEIAIIRLRTAIKYIEKRTQSSS